MKYIYYLSLGANLGDRLATIGKAVEALGQQGEIIRVSQMYETPPWGKLDQPAFINCAVVIVSKLVPVEFLHGCQRIEKIWAGFAMSIGEPEPWMWIYCVSRV